MNAGDMRRAWEATHGKVLWGTGVAEAIVDIEARLAALESSRPVQIAPEQATDGANDPERDNTDNHGPGDGYRWVQKGEIILASDESEREAVGWWGPVRPWLVGRVCDTRCTYRRLVAGDPLSRCCHELANSQGIIERKNAEIARLTAERDAALAGLERHRMTSEERDAVVNGLYCLAGYLDRTKEGQ